MVRAALRGGKRFGDRTGLWIITELKGWECACLFILKCVTVRVYTQRMCTCLRVYTGVYRQCLCVFAHDGLQGGFIVLRSFLMDSGREIHSISLNAEKP